MCRFPIQTNLRALIIALLVAAVAFFCNAAIRAFDATSPYPTIQGPDGTLYAVVPDYATNYDSPDDFSHETRRASSGLFSAFFSNRDDLLEWETLYRGQTPSLIPRRIDVLELNDRLKLRFKRHLQRRRPAGGRLRLPLRTHPRRPRRRTDDLSKNLQISSGDIRFLYVPPRFQFQGARNE